MPKLLISILISLTYLNVFSQDTDKTVDRYFQRQVNSVFGNIQSVWLYYSNSSKEDTLDELSTISTLRNILHFRIPELNIITTFIDYANLSSKTESPRLVIDLKKCQSPYLDEYYGSISISLYRNVRIINSNSDINPDIPVWEESYLFYSGSNKVERKKQFEGILENLLDEFALLYYKAKN